MNNNTYNKAVNYAAKLNGYGNHRDLVHDGYLEWFTKTGKNLFEENEGRVLTVVKFVYLSTISRSKFMWRGITYNRFHLEFQESEDLGFVSGINLYNPEHQFIHQESLKALEAGLDSLQKQVYDRLSEGYNTTEIAEEMGTYRQQINHKVKKIEKQLEVILR